MKRLFISLMAIATIAMVGCTNSEEPVPQPTAQIVVNTITDISATVDVTISDTNAYYICSFFPTSVAKDMTEDSIKTLLSAQVIAYLENYTAQYLAKNNVLFQGNKTLSASGMTPNTDYTFALVVIDAVNKVPTEMVCAYDKTKEAMEHFTVTLDSIVYAEGTSAQDTVIYYTITPDDAITTYVALYTLKATVDKSGATSYFNSYISYYGSYIYYLLKQGKVSGGVKYTGAGLEDGTVVTVLVAGVNSSASLLTPVYEKDFTITLPVSETGEPSEAPRSRNITDEVVMLKVPFTAIPMTVVK